LITRRDFFKGAIAITGMPIAFPIIVPFLVFVHYEPKHSEIVKQERLKCRYPIKILTDQQAFLVKDNEIKLVGDGPEVKI